MRYVVTRNNHILAYVDSEEKAFEKIKEFYKLRENCKYEIYDMVNEKNVNVSAYVQMLAQSKLFNKRKNPVKTDVIMYRKNDIVDEKYSEWLCTQRCVVTGAIAKRGAGSNDMHAHHIYGRARGRNDYMQISLIGYAHSWGYKSYHNCTENEFVAHWGLVVNTLVDYFETCAKDFVEKYKKECGVLLH